MNFSDELLNAEIEFRKNEFMKFHTTFKVGGPADYYLLPKNTDEIIFCINKCNEYNMPYVFIGKGSNLLVHDEGFRGAVICLSTQYSEIKLLSKTEIYCQSGASVASLCDFALKNNLSGLEFAYGIPGNIGGAVVMNAGAYGGEIKDILIGCSYADENGHIYNVSAFDLNLSYRHSIFTDKKYCVLGATFSLTPASFSEIKEKMTDYISRRKEKQPLEFPSAGSTFKRPNGSYASMLIDKCGLKGYSVGDVQVSEKHAGFVINKGNASFNDIISLTDYIKKKVFDMTGYSLELEVEII